MSPSSLLVFTPEQSDRAWSSAIEAPTLSSSFLPNRLYFLNWRMLSGFFEQLNARPLNTSEQLEKFLDDFAELEEQVHDAYQHLHTLEAIMADAPETIAFHKNIQHHEYLWDSSRNKLYERLSSSRLFVDNSDSSRVRLAQIIENRSLVFNHATSSLENHDKRLCDQLEKVHSAINSEIDQLDADNYSDHTYWLATQDIAQRKQVEVTERVSGLVSLRRQKALMSYAASYGDLVLHERDTIDYRALDIKTAAEAVLDHFGALASDCITRRMVIEDVKTFRPWHDTGQVGIPYRESLNDYEELQAHLRDFIGGISPELQTLYDHNKPLFIFDLYAREGKEIGSFITTYPRMGKAFLCTNLDGTNETLTDVFHEFAHLLETQASKEQPYYYYRQHPPEVSEGIAIGFELIASEFYKNFFNPKVVSLARSEIIDDQIITLVSNARTTLFELWLYDQAGSDPVAWGEKWAELSRRAIPGINWNKYEQYEQWSFLDETDFICTPLDTANYVLGGLNGFRLFLNFRADRELTGAQIVDAMKCGDSLPLPEIYAKAGVPFRFDSDMVRELASEVRKLRPKLTD